MGDPVEVLLVVFDRIDAVEGEGREQRRAHDRFAHGRHGGRVLVAQQVAAQAGLGPLGILELHDPRPLDRLLADAEQARGHLGDHVVGVGDEALGIAAFAGAGEAVEGLGHPGLAQQDADVGRAERHAAAVPGHVDGDLRPRVVAAVQHAVRWKCLRGAGPAGGAAGKRNRSRSKPPPESPISLSRCGRAAAGPSRPSASCCTIRSGVQR